MRCSAVHSDFSLPAHIDMAYDYFTIQSLYRFSTIQKMKFGRCIK